MEIPYRYHWQQKNRPIENGIWDSVAPQKWDEINAMTRLGGLPCLVDRSALEQEREEHCHEPYQCECAGGGGCIPKPRERTKDPVVRYQYRDFDHCNTDSVSKLRRVCHLDENEPDLLSESLRWHTFSSHDSSSRVSSLICFPRPPLTVTRKTWLALDGRSRVSTAPTQNPQYSLKVE